MRIVYIVLKGMPLGGGIEKYTEEIGSRLVANGHNVIVYTMKHYGATSGFYKGMKIKTVPTIRTRSFEKITTSVAATSWNLFEPNVDIVHFHAFGPAMFCFLPRILGRKIVVQGHGLEWKRTKWGLVGKSFLKLAEVPSVRFPHVVTVVSKVQKEYLAKKYGIHSVYIPTGVNSPLMEEPDIIKKYGLKGNDYILFAARLVREKGAHYLIQGYNSLNPDLKLVIAGDAEHEASYKSELLSLAKGNKNIIFPGFVTGKTLNELMSNCYTFVLPSEIEGLPTGLLEAMSYKNCCIVSDIPENLEALNGHGYSFKNKNIADLSRTIEYLINNRDAVESVKAPAQKYVLGNFSWDKIAEQFEELYGNLIQ